MPTLSKQQQLCQNFAALLGYPDDGVWQTATASAALLR